MVEGSCLCGGVRYQVDGEPKWMTRCHCVQCRKASGAEFATNASFPLASFRVREGDSLLSSYEWRPGEARYFCSRCGSQLFKRSASKPEYVRLRLGTLDTELDSQPREHLFVGEKPAWSVITDDLPQREGFPPDYFDSSK